MIKIVIALIVVSCLAIGGCAGMSETEQRALSGGALGAAGGAIIGAIAGDAGLGVAIGGAVGAGGGYLYGKHREAEQNAYREGYEAGRSSR
ncbi:MAG: glycine zipper domain-containing protein [Deltaproteobacteria bacterium]|nr:glycine zipper domain-containing protein [Deltaproteobacteria bacterium]